LKRLILVDPSSSVNNEHLGFFNTTVISSLSRLRPHPTILIMMDHTIWIISLDITG
jgi:hypothetical protein